MTLHFQVGLAYDSQGCVIGGALELTPWSSDTDNIRVWFENATMFLHGVCLSKVQDLGEIGLHKERVRFFVRLTIMQYIYFVNL